MDTLCSMESICRVLAIVPSACCVHVSRQTDPERRSLQTVRDEVLSGHI
ncbi:hypothetical protein [Azorhizophilus paspali]|uniref:Transposase n=1 Tax=Azorhizophilus paspali TaxID=69963 RepID=A0ABV6SIS4_AZOPA